MIYQYIPYIEAGVNGYVLHARLGEEDTRIGEVDGIHYVHSLAPMEQDERIGFKEATLTPELKEKLKAVRPHKAFARMKIDAVGDVYDLVADAMKLIEFNMMLTARLAGDLWGTNPIEEAKKAEYAARNKAFLDAVEAGAITLRGDFEDMDTVMARLMGRVSTINELVRDHYVSELQKVGL